MKPVTGKSLRRKLPDNVRRAIIVLIYGSDANFTRTVMPPTRVAKLLKISRKTVQSVVKYFRQQNSDLENFCDRRTMKPHTLDKIDPRIKKEILKKDMLQLWATKTLEERVALIKFHYNYDITVYKLRKLYMVNGIKWRNTQLVYRSHLIKRNGLDVERVEFIKRILGFIMSD